MNQNFLRGFPQKNDNFIRLWLIVLLLETGQFIKEKIQDIYLFLACKIKNFEKKPYEKQRCIVLKKAEIISKKKQE